MTATTMARPYGLSHQRGLGPEHTRPEILDRAVYDPTAQLTTIDGAPLAAHPRMADMTVTWGTTNNDNKSDTDK